MKLGQFLNSSIKLVKLWAILTDKREFITYGRIIIEYLCKNTRVTTDIKKMQKIFIN